MADTLSYFSSGWTIGVLFIVLGVPFGIFVSLCLARKFGILPKTLSGNHPRQSERNDRE